MALTHAPSPPKVKEPDTFDGTRSKLRLYLAQCTIYIEFNDDKFRADPDKVLWATTFLTGAAFDWVETAQKDYFECGSNFAQWDEATKEIFQSFSGFKEKISRVFGDVDEERSAERRLQGLRQRGAASAYAAEFQQYAGRMGWNDDALMAQFYKGLKDSVKDEMARRDKPASLQRMMDGAIKVDNRLYERSLERKGHYSIGHANKRGGGPKKQTSYWPQPMELDAAFRGKPQPSKDEMDRRRRDKLCFECGLPGHMASSHRKGNNNRKPWKGKKQFNATGRGGYDMTRPPYIGRSRQLNATNRRRHFNRQELKTEGVTTQELYDQLERDGICTQPETDNESWGTLSDTNDSQAPTVTENTTNIWGMPTISETSYSGYPSRYPQLGQVWEVCQFEAPRGSVKGTREWWDPIGNNFFKEKSGVYQDGPQHGERYTVVYQDQHRIGWNQVGGNRNYWMRLPPPALVTEPPTVGEFWELVRQTDTTRYWLHTTDLSRLYAEELNPDHDNTFAEGHIYRCTKIEEPYRGWQDVLTGKRYYELCGNDHSYMQLFCIVTLNGKKLRAMIDSGATGNFISPAAVIQNNLRTKVKTEPYALSVIDGTPINQDAGNVSVETTPLTMDMHRGHTEVIRLDVVSMGNHQLVLGMPWIRQHNPTIDWIKESIVFDRCTCASSQLRQEIKDRGEICATSRKESGYQAQDPLLKQIPVAYHEFLDMFREETGIEALPKHGKWDHEIPIEEGKEPPFSPIYPMSADDLRTLKEYIDTNLEKGFIRPSTSPAGSPVLFVPKKGGEKRLCIDYRKLNAITIKDRYPLPLADELRARLQGAKMFTKLDLRGAYNLVRIKEGEEWKTAFRTRYGHYEYQVMPFGLTNAPASCMRMMNEVLGPFLDKTCICYLDDILVYSSKEEEHAGHVKGILKALADANLLCKPEKCEFHTKRTEFLGFVVTPGGLSMDPSKVSAILEWKPPTNVRETQSFLGFANFYRRFVKGYSAIAAPLTELTKKDQDFAWTNKAQTAFDELKQAFTEAPILMTFDPEKPITVETDSSDYALGAVLSQPGETGK